MQIWRHETAATSDGWIDCLIHWFISNTVWILLCIFTGLTHFTTYLGLSHFTTYLGHSHFTTYLGLSHFTI